jgi:hypothetical protein
LIVKEDDGKGTASARRIGMKGRGRWTFGLVAAAVVALGACATAGGGSGGDTEDRDVITRAQMAGLEHLSVYDAVRRLKPAWLRTSRGTDSFITEMQSRRGVRVYVDGALRGGAAELRQLSVQDVQEVRRLDARQATMEFGMDHTEGALLVKTR